MLTAIVAAVGAIGAAVLCALTMRERKQVDASVAAAYRETALGAESLLASLGELEQLLTRDGTGGPASSDPPAGRRATLARRSQQSAELLPYHHLTSYTGSYLHGEPGVESIRWVANLSHWGPYQAEFRVAAARFQVGQTYVRHIAAMSRDVTTPIGGSPDAWDHIEFLALLDPSEKSYLAETLWIRGLMEFDDQEIMRSSAKAISELRLVIATIKWHDANWVADARRYRSVPAEVQIEKARAVSPRTPKGRSPAIGEKWWSQGDAAFA